MRKSYFCHRYIEDLANIYHHERLPYIETIQGLSLTIQCGLSEIPVYVLTGTLNNYTLWYYYFSLFYLRKKISHQAMTIPRIFQYFILNYKSVIEIIDSRTKRLKSFEWYSDALILCLTVLKKKKARKQF